MPTTLPDLGHREQSMSRRSAASPRAARPPSARCPSCTSMRASQPSRRRAFSTEGQRRTTSTSKLGRCSSANSSGSRPHASQMIAASSATVRSSDAETLKSSLRPDGEAVAVTIPSAMSSMCVSVRVCVPSPKIGSGAPARQAQALADEVGDHVGDPRLVLGHLAGPVGVERAADRVGQAVLVVRGAHVDLAGELGEPVGRARDRRVDDVLLGRRVLGRALEDHRARDVGEALDVVVERRAHDGVVERVVDLGQRVGQLVEVGDPADDRRQVDHVRAAPRRLARLVEHAQVAGVDLAALAHPVGRRALVGDAHLEVGVAQQAAHDRRADRAGAAGDEDPVHGRGTVAGAVSARGRGPRARRPLRRDSRPSPSPGRASRTAQAPPAPEGVRRCESPAPVCAPSGT